MRIIYLHQYFIPPNGAGGTRSFEFARRLIAHGHRVIMITSSAYLPDEDRPHRLVAKMNMAGIPTIVINSAYTNALGFYARIWAFIKFALVAAVIVCRQPADIVFATSTPLTIAVPALCAKLGRRIPMVFEVRDLWPELPIAMGALRHPLLKFLARALEQLAYRSASHVIALSPGMADGVRRCGISSNRVTVIPNSCDVELFDVPTARGEGVRRQLGLDAVTPLIVYCGTFGVINDVGYLVRVAIEMRAIDPDIHFLLVGDGAERVKIARKAQSSGILDQTVHLWKPVPKQVVPDLLAASTIATSLFVSLPAMEHNSANKFFDGLAAGKPLAINYGGWQAELLHQYGAGIVLPAYDTQRAAHRLAQLARDQERLSAAANAARTLAYTRFARDDMAARFEDILCNVVLSANAQRRYV